MTSDIGNKIKQLRNMKKLTLKELSAKTDLSIGFLSQVERGVTSVAIASLENIASALDVDLSYFFSLPKKNKKRVLRSFEQEIFTIQNSQFIDYHLTQDPEDKDFLPRLQVVLPCKDDCTIDVYQHEGEEFVYVLEGILTIMINNERYELFPGDSMHFDSKLPHNWTNYTNKTVKLLVVNSPNQFNPDHN